MQAFIAELKTWLKQTKQRAREFWKEFRARSVYFQLKALVLVVYAAVVSLTTAWVMWFPSGVGENEIDARILVLEGDMVMGRYFVVENGGRDHWIDVSFEIDQGYLVKRQVVSAGEKITLFLRDFKKKVIRKRRGREIPKTQAAPPTLKVTELKIECNEGVATKPIRSSQKKRFGL